MKQFSKILKFEFMGYLKNRTFVGITMFLVAAIIVCMFIPNIAAYFKSDTLSDGGEPPVMIIYAQDSELSSAVKPRPLRTITCKLPMVHLTT